MKTTSALIPALLLFSLPVLGGWSDCGSSLVNDPSFDLWCGEALCYWNTGAGSVKKVPTWHEDDYGVEMIGDPAQISQLVTKQVRCLHFETLAEVDPTTTVILEMDFEDNGIIDYSAPVPGNDWAAVSYLVTAPTSYDNVRFILRKTGPGRAVLAHLRVTSSDSCTAPPIPLDDRSLGSTCEADPQCGEGHCLDGVWPYQNADGVPRACGLCSTAADCSGGEACGVETTATSMYRGCGLYGRHNLGERCVEDEECSTGVCCDWVCSQCCQNDHCPTGQECQHTTYSGQLADLTWIPMPWQCSPGGYQGEAGAPCLMDADCRSTTCGGGGDLMLCLFDGRVCRGDSDCPLGGATKEGPACRAVGRAGGYCR